MEFLLVTYPHEREVLIEGVEAGLTNQLITLAPGTYTITLAPPRDFVPRQQEIVVEDTSPMDPLEIVFA
jgi:hypothetical protein